MSVAYINGEFYALEDARVDATDRGFLFGDGIYEVIYVNNGVPYQFDEHIERYMASAEGLMLEKYPNYNQLKEITDELLERSKITQGLIYLQVTRGSSTRQHHFPEGIEPTVFLYINTLNKDPEWEIKRTKGVKTILVPDDRWDKCYIKTVNLLPNCIYKEKAKRAGAYEAIQVHEEAGVTEGTSTNIFGVKKGKLYTAPEGKRVLPGVTRKTVLMLARQLGIEVHEEYMSKDELLNCDEVFLSSTINLIIPINQVDVTEFDVSRYEITFMLQEKLDEFIKKETKEL